MRILSIAFRLWLLDRFGGFIELHHLKTSQATHTRTMSTGIVITMTVRFICTLQDASSRAPEIFGFWHEKRPLTDAIRARFSEKVYFTGMWSVLFIVTVIMTLWVILLASQGTDLISIVCIVCIGVPTVDVGSSNLQERNDYFVMVRGRVATPNCDV